MEFSVDSVPLVDHGLFIPNLVFCDMDVSFYDRSQPVR